MMDNDNLKENRQEKRNIAIGEEVIALLRDRDMTLAFCESCTGGLLSQMITSVAGASDVFDRAIISYSNRAKIEELGVSPNSLSKYGAVSQEVAYEMARGLILKSKVDLVVSTTGIAGPSSDKTGKPVGLVYICIMTEDEHKIIQCNFSGSRQDIQIETSLLALEEIKLVLNKQNIDS